MVSQVGMVNSSPGLYMLPGGEDVSLRKETRGMPIPRIELVQHYWQKNGEKRVPARNELAGVVPALNESLNVTDSLNDPSRFV